MKINLKRFVAVSFIALLVVSLVLPTSNAYAEVTYATDGTTPDLMNSDGTLYSNTSGGLINAFDNDISTRTGISFTSKYVAENFDGVYNLTEVYFDVLKLPDTLTLTLYSEPNQQGVSYTHTLGALGSGAIKATAPLTEQGIQSYRLQGSSTASNVFEFYIKGEKVEQADTIPPANVGSLTATGSNGIVELNWTNPTDTDFSHIKILRDGVLLADNVTDTFFTDSDVVNENTYVYTLIAYDLSNNESTGRTVTGTPTEGDVTAPDEITSLTENITSDSVTFNYLLPIDSDFDRVILYKDGVEYDSTTGTTITVTGLTESTQYSFKFTTVDIYGNESNGVIKSVSTLELADTEAPSAPTGLTHIVGNGSITLDWNNNQETDLDGYFVYVDGQKANATPIKSSYYTLNGLTNSNDYQVAVSAVDKSGNESPISTVTTVTPSELAMPLLSIGGYDLTDVADGVGVWFASLWLIVAFAVAIPLSFYIANRVKLLFLA